MLFQASNPRLQSLFNVKECKLIKLSVKTLCISTRRSLLNSSRLKSIPSFSFFLLGIELRPCEATN